MLHRVIVTRDPAGHWNAAFEDAPQSAIDSQTSVGSNLRIPIVEKISEI